VKKLLNRVTWVTTFAAVGAVAVAALAWRDAAILEDLPGELMQECICNVAHPVIGEPLAHSEWACESSAPQCERSAVAAEFARYDSELPLAHDRLVDRAIMFFWLFSLAAIFWLLRLLFGILARSKKPG